MLGVWFLSRMEACGPPPAWVCAVNIKLKKGDLKVKQHYLCLQLRATFAKHYEKHYNTELPVSGSSL
ncbi:hypothetical protein K1T71_010253 [Dendrolimus kikuchii]|uniref:Uncharacterized protein n=1 Tax=Dendrolimus kikuchii TaxID=765133 RepID=A0ACC1CR84_9NEOP|nr:hypothetical protein K1T71_010253 [Dendrolimus kikuchii]